MNILSSFADSHVVPNLYTVMLWNTKIEFWRIFMLLFSIITSDHLKVNFSNHKNNPYLFGCMKILHLCFTEKYDSIQVWSTT